MKAECSTTTNNKVITFQEKRSTIIFENPHEKEVTCVLVDGCEITSGVRCDHLLIHDKTEHYIELKGQDINHAIDQLVTSIRELSTNIKKQPKISYIICTRSPLNSATIQNIQAKFKKNYNSKLIVKSSPYKVRL